MDGVTSKRALQEILNDGSISAPIVFPLIVPCVIALYGRMPRRNRRMGKVMREIMTDPDRGEADPAALRIMFLGLRGIPGVQGGIETHVEHLAPALAELGYLVDVIVRSRYMLDPALTTWRGVRLHRIWSPNSRRLETIVHSILGVLYAAIRRPDILHIHGIGPSLTVPLARLAGLRVVVTHHGTDYDREKWARKEKAVLRWGESLGMRFANAVIVITRGLGALVSGKYGRTATIIPNGVPRCEPVATVAALDRFGLAAGRYVLCVGRLVPEKRQLDLVEAFARSHLSDWKLVLVGGADHDSPYSEKLREVAAATPNVVAAGTQTGQALAELYSHAGLFVLPSSHEGLPISLLEAMSYGLPVVVSDIPPHLELELEPWSYFHLGDVDALAAKMDEIAIHPWSSEKREAIRDRVRREYDWGHIARETATLYEDVAAGRSQNRARQPSVKA